MINSEEEKKLHDLRLNIAIFNFEDDLQKMQDEKNKKYKKKRKNIFMNKKIIATACASLVLVSSIVIANHIKSNKVISTIENVKILDNIGVNVNVKKFQANDYNLTTNIVLRFDNSIKDKVDIKEVFAVDLLDFIVRDEENKIIYSMVSDERFEEYCIENNLDYKLGSFNENYLNCGLNQFIEYKDDNLLEIQHSIYSDNNKLPQSNKLYYSFQTIRLWVLDSSTKKATSYELKGDWNFELNVLE